MEPKECTASVLEALMGFDEQQSQRHAPKYFRVLSEGYLRRVASIGVLEKKSRCKNHPFRMAIEDPKELVNILEVEDTCKNDRHCNKLGDREKANIALLAECMPLTRQNFVNEKHFSTDKMIQTSKEFQDLLEVTDSMDISPRHTKEQNYIFNHVENVPSALKSSYTFKNGINSTGTKFKDREQGQVYSSEDLDLLKSLRTFLEWRDKPRLSSSSPASLKGPHLVSENCKEFLSSQNRKHIAKEKERKTLVSIRQPSRVSRVLDGSRGKKRHDLVNLFMTVSRPESIYDDACRKETEFTRTSSPGLSNWKADYQQSCFVSVESHQARESMEKILEEQKMTENSELMLSRQGRKLNEMPIHPHHATFPNDLNCKPVKYGFQKHCSNGEHLYSGSPLCLSHGDDRLDQLSKNSQRFRFHSASAATARCRTRSRYESLRNTWFLKSGGPAYWQKCKPLDKSSNKEDASEPTLRSSSKNLRIFPCPDSASDHVVNDTCMVVGDLKAAVEKRGLFDQHSLNFLSSRCSVILCTQNNPIKRENQAIEFSSKNECQDDNLSVAASNVVAVKSDVVDVSTVDFKKQEHDSVSCVLFETDDDSFTNSSHATHSSIQQEASTEFDKEGSTFAHYTSKELDAIVSLEEAYQPSPVSVLEPLFKEETLSSSESLKKLGINDLMMQLELLVSESLGTNSEGPEMIVSSDDDGGEGSICSSKESEDILSTFKFKDSRDFSYLVDVLTEAGLHCKNLDKGCVTLHGQKCHLISPSVFETLEKKFGEQISWRRSERRLLFDRINSGLMELFRSFVGVPEWAKPVSRRFRPLLDREMIEEELWILLDSQEREVTKDLVDKQFGKEIGWIDLGDEIDSVCRELERSLIEELVAEFCSMGYF